MDPVRVVLGEPAGLARVPVPRPDGGHLYPVASEPAGASRAGVAIDVAGVGGATIASPGAGERLLDRERVTVAGQDAERTLMLAPLAPVAVVVEQWRFSVAGRRVTLTATADLARWASLGPLLRAAVAGARVEFPS